MRDWIEYWNTDTPIYVSERHKALHYRIIASDIAGLIEAPAAAVLDQGCGEALSAGHVAARCSRLFLCEAADTVRARLEGRFAGHPVIRVIGADAVAGIEDASLDLVVANSIAQYLSEDELRALLGLWRRKLKPGGRLVLGDVLPEGLSALTDALALLRFGASGGFLGAALLGLVRTALSDYRRLRQQLGLRSYSEQHILDLFDFAGFEARRLPRNLGHNQARMAIEGRPA